MLPRRLAPDVYSNPPKTSSKFAKTNGVAVHIRHQVRGESLSKSNWLSKLERAGKLKRAVAHTLYMFIVLTNVQNFCWEGGIICMYVYI